MSGFISKRPCVDVTFGSAPRAFRDKWRCALVLTGMGADGREGALALLKTAGSDILGGRMRQLLMIYLAF